MTVNLDERFKGHRNESRQTAIVDADQLQLRVRSLQRIAVRFDGIPLKADGDSELWALGERGRRFTFRIPMLHAISEAQGDDASRLVQALCESEHVVGKWLTGLLASGGSILAEPVEMEPHSGAEIAV